MSQPAIIRRVIAKTAAYQIESKKDKSGTLFTNRGATGAVTFTLPPPGRCSGYEYIFAIYADQSVTIQTKTADTLVTFNDIAADSLAVSTASKKIGAVVRALCDGTSWFVAQTAADGVTGTISTIAT